MLLCVGQTAQDVTEETGRQAELLEARLSDVTSRRLGTRTLMKKMCERLVVPYITYMDKVRASVPHRDFHCSTVEGPKRPFQDEIVPLSETSYSLHGLKKLQHPGKRLDQFEWLFKEHSRNLLLLFNKVGGFIRHILKQ